MTKVKFTDVAHLYLGCDMRHRWSSADDAQVIKLTADRLKFGTTDWIPMLIPLDEITLDKKTELAIPILESTLGPTDYSSLIKSLAAVPVKLLSEGYDLFDLIKNHEAIRKEVSNG